MMQKPTKKAAELEVMIRLEMEEICAWPTGLVTVKPGGWRVEIMGAKTQSLDDLREVIGLIADGFRIEYDLAS
jgi:hypothetical protein